MVLPRTFTHLGELKLDWNKIVGKLPIYQRGYLLTIDKRDLCLMSTGFRHPILAIPHPEYRRLNGDVSLIVAIATLVNDRTVNRFGGVRFIKPMADPTLIRDLTEAFNAETIDVF